MQVKTLQGINHLSPYSVVQIKTDGKPETDLLDLVDSFHPIFLKSYRARGKTITIESLLPQIWREAAEAFNKRSTGEWSFNEAKDFLLNKVIKGQIYSMSTIPIIEAAQRKGLETNLAFANEGIEMSIFGYPGQWNRYYRVGVGRHSCITVSAGSNGDSIIALKISRDKKISNTHVDMLNLPNAKWQVIEDEKELAEVFDSYPKPVVIKPVGLTQGSGVTTNIHELKHAKKAFKYAKEKIETKIRKSWQQKVMIQQQVPGDDYRILAIDGKMEIATKRIPAFVTGDGKSTLKELIKETNKDPRRDVENPAHTLKPIKFDEMLDEYLEEQNLDLKHVPDADERVYVRKVASMSQGGITEDYTDKVHPQIRFMVESIAASAHANVVGVDVICNDISKPLTTDNGSFIEINTMPEAYLNAFPVLGQQHEDIGDKILAGLLKHKKSVAKIVAVGGSQDALFQYLSQMGLLDRKSHTGIISEGKYYINNQEMNEVDDMWTAVKAAKLNASLGAIVYHYDSWKEVEKHGTGFDMIDLLITEEVDETFKDYQERAFIKGVVTWGEIL